jgi:outer membrane protein assembly factor BamB
MEALRSGDPRRFGTYQVLARLGSGSMGQVFLGRSAGGRMVAIKVVHPALAGDRDFRARFAHEVAAARAVSGAFTAPVIDADPDAPSPWLVTTYLPGYSLREVVERSGPLPPWSVRSLGAGLAEALIGIHRAGVLHRDLKPSNVLLTPDGPRVIDFGIARAAEVSAVTRTGASIGSPGYMPPEQATGAETGPSADVFSLGAVLTFAATGHGPFGEGAMHELMYRVVHQPPWLDGIADPDLYALIASCLEKDPTRRPDAEHVLQRLAPPVPPYGVGWLPPPIAAEITRPIPVPSAGIGRRKVLFGALGAVAGVGVIAGGAALLTSETKRGANGTWTFKPATGEITGGPAVAGGLVFLTASYSAKNLVAVDPRTGKQRWAAEGVSSPHAASPLQVVVANNVVYATGASSDFVGLNLANGGSLWNAAGPGGIVADPAPVVAGGLLFAAGGTASAPVLTAYAGGQQKWTFNTGDSVQANPVAAGQMVYIVTGRGTVFGIDLTGQARWRKTLASDAEPLLHVEATPVLSGGMLYVVTDSDVVYAFDAATGEQKWKSNAIEQHNVGPVSMMSAAGGTVYVALDGGPLSAFNAADGKHLWSHEFSGERGNPIAKLPVVGNGMAFCFDHNTLYALDAATGTVRWQATGLHATFESPVLAAGAVHFCSLDEVKSFDPATGRVLRSVPNDMGSDLVASGNFLYWREFYAIRAAKAKG